MMAQASRDWSVFKQIFADHWRAFQHAHPRYQTSYEPPSANNFSVGLRSVRMTPLPSPANTVASMWSSSRGSNSLVSSSKTRSGKQSFQRVSMPRAVA